MNDTTWEEARSEAARLALEAVLRVPRPTAGRLTVELCVVEAWLRRRALGGDKIAIRQIERELGRQVKVR